MSFSRIKGNSKIISSIKKLIHDGNFPSSSLFYGTAGCGKLLTATETVKAHLCSGELSGDGLFEEKTGKNEDGACGKCETCQQIEKRLHPDFRIVDASFQAALLDEPVEKQKNLKIDSLREISRFAYERPYVAEKKFIIIDDADTMTVEAQNSFLKILEEPPKNSVIILTASDKNLLLPTIVSRVFPFKFNPLSKEDLSDILGRAGIENKEAVFLADIAAGSVSKAMAFRELMADFSSKKHFGRLLPFMMLPQRAQAFENRARAKLILDFLTCLITADRIKPALSFERKAREVNLLLNYAGWLKHNVSPRTITQLALTGYLKYGNFDFGEKA